MRNIDEKEFLKDVLQGEVKVRFNVAGTSFFSTEEPSLSRRDIIIYLFQEVEEKRGLSEEGLERIEISPCYSSENNEEHQMYKAIRLDVPIKVRGEDVLIDIGFVPRKYTISYFHSLTGEVLTFSTERFNEIVFDLDENGINKLVFSIETIKVNEISCAVTCNLCLV